MTSSELAAELLELTKTWTGVCLILGFKGTPIFAAIYAFVGEEQPRRLKSLNELAAEISGLMDYDYAPVGWIRWYEYAPQQAQLQVQAFDTGDAWAMGILESIATGTRDALRKMGHKVDTHQ
jgi:hypothetical protein